MSEKKLDQLVETVLSAGEEVQHDRDGIIAELRKLGDAFARVLKAKFDLDVVTKVDYLPPLPNAIEAGYPESNVVMLSLALSARLNVRMNILTCQFDGNGAFPCILVSGDQTVICQGIKKLPDALTELCDKRGVYLRQDVERFKKALVEPSANEEVASAPDSNSQDDVTANEVARPTS